MKLNECLANSNGKIVASKDLDVKGAKEFILFDNHQALLDKMGESDFNNYYEVFVKEKPWNFVIDLDLKKEEPDFDTPDVLLEDLIERFWTNVDDYAGFECTEEDTVVLVSPPTEIKKSYHIIFRIKNVFFKDHLVCKDFAAYFDGKIDNAIYTSNRSFRTLHSSKLSKPGKNLEFHPMTTSTKPLDSFGSLCRITNDTKYITKKKALKKREAFVENTGNNDIDILELLMKLGSNRYTERNLWLEIGYILKGISEDPTNYLAFSKQWSGFNEKECENTFNSLDIELEPESNIGKLIRLHNIDNPDAKYIDISTLECSDANVSKYIYDRYGDKFVCASIRDKTFYYFNGNTWKIEDSNYNLRLKIITEVKDSFEKHRKKVRNDPKASLREQRNAENLVNIVSTGYDLKCVELYFQNQDFTDKLNMAENLLAFENGIFELDTGIFRNGRPEDYLSFTTKIEYKPVKDYKQIKKLLKSIFPDKITLGYVMKVFVSFLFGRNKEEFCYIWTGSGGNGKGLLQDIFKRCLGDLFLSGKTSIITSQREESGGSNSAIVALKSKRLVIFPEAESKAKLNIGTIKQFSGGDEISARGLYKSEETFLPTFKMVLCCNLLPEIENIDGGVKRRLKVIDFPTKFVDNPTKPWEAKLDSSLKSPENQKILGAELIHLLLDEYLPIYLEEGLYNVPKSIEFSTGNFFDNNDVVKTFCANHLVEDEKGFIKKNEVKNIYNNDKEYQVFKFPNFITAIERHLGSVFVEKMVKHSGKSYKNTLKGYSFKEFEEDLDFEEEQE